MLRRARPVAAAAAGQACGHRPVAALADRENPLTCPTVTPVSPRKARRLPAGLPRRPRGGLPPARPGAEGEDDAEVPALRLGPERIEPGPDGDWVVRAMPGDATVKTYRCPGCDQEIKPGTAHLVVWPAYTPGLAERRHWHRPCWDRRMRRHPQSRPGR